MSEQPEEPDMMDLAAMVEGVQMVRNPRVAFVLTEEGTVHFGSSIHPGEAADALMEMAEEVRRQMCNHHRRHFDRSRAARWN